MSYSLSGKDIFGFILNDELLLKSFGGIFSIDEIPLLVEPNKYVIVNSDPSFLPGKHWFCMFYAQGSNVEFFDSLGKEPFYYSSNIIQSVNKYKKIIYSSKKIQPSNSSTCALYCLYYIYHRLRGYNFSSILNVFSDIVEHNDVIVIDFIHNFPEIVNYFR